MRQLKRVAVTGGAGQIAYSLLMRIANGEMFGLDQPIALHILEVPAVFGALQGIMMELEDCAFPLLKEICIGHDPKAVFEGVNCAILIGSKPRGPGMERVDLLVDNAKIFVEQGKALNEVADRDVKVLVVANPCNTNCLIAMHHAPKIPHRNFHAMTRLDQNRATAMLAKRAKVDVTDVKNVTIWGNHSANQVPDYFNAKIKDKPVTLVINDEQWLQNDFIPAVQKRGAAVIAARGKSSAASAAHAIVEAVKSLETPTPNGLWFSSCVSSKENPYGIENDLIFSFPCRSKGNWQWEIVKDLKWNDFLREKIKASEKELIEERTLIKK